jgi:hypothetical protein
MLILSRCNFKGNDLAGATVYACWFKRDRGIASDSWSRPKTLVEGGRRHCGCRVWTVQRLSRGPSRKKEKIMTISIKRITAEIEGDVERWSRLGKQFASICEGKNAEDVFFSALLFFSNNYAVEFGEERRGCMTQMLYTQLLADIQGVAQDSAREHWRDCVDCRQKGPCDVYFRIIDSIAEEGNEKTLRVNSGGSFEFSDQPCPHES